MTSNLAYSLRLFFRSFFAAKFGKTGICHVGQIMKCQIGCWKGVFKTWSENASFPEQLHPDAHYQ